MVSSTEGSAISTGWKRRSSAGSFSMCLRYSFIVVAPMARSSPRASAGFNMFEASIEPSAARQFGQVSSVLLQGPKRRFRSLRGYAMTPPHGRKGLHKGLARRSVARQQLPGGIFGAPRDGQQDVFRGNVLILEFLRFIKCRFEYLVRVFAQVLLRNTADLWETRKLRMDLRLQALRAHTETIEERRHDSIVLGHPRCQQVQVLYLRVAFPCSTIVRRL